MYNYDDYDEEIDETLNEENIEEKGYRDNQNKKKDKKTKKTKKRKVVKNKTKKEKPKTKVVYKEKEKSSGCLSFILVLIILGLLGVIGYLVYVNYYEPEENIENPQTQKDTTEKMCEAKATKFSISSGLKKCSEYNQFKLTINGTNLSFDITRTTDQKYIINSIYYKNQKINVNKIIGIKLDENFQLKEKDNIIYLLVQSDENHQFLTVIDNGNVIYQNSGSEYKLSSDITYTKYTELGIEDINTCEYYETNNLLDSEMWTRGELVYENGNIIEKQNEVVTAKDVCKK